MRKSTKSLFLDLQDLQQGGVALDTRILVDDGELAIHQPLLQVWGQWWSGLGQAGEDNVVMLPGVSLAEAHEFVDILYDREVVNNEHFTVIEGWKIMSLTDQNCIDWRQALSFAQHTPVSAAFKNQTTLCGWNIFLFYVDTSLIFNSYCRTELPRQLGSAGPTPSEGMCFIYKLIVLWLTSTDAQQNLNLTLQNKSKYV